MTFDLLWLPHTEVREWAGEGKAPDGSVYILLLEATAELTLGGILWEGYFAYFVLSGFFFLPERLNSWPSHALPLIHTLSACVGLESSGVFCLFIYFLSFNREFTCNISFFFSFGYFI